MKIVMKKKKTSNGVEVALIHWTTNKCTPYVVAWCCPSEFMLETENGLEFMGSWGQGHYFVDIENALKFYNENYNMKFEVEIIDREVFINGEFVSQLCWDNDSIGYAISNWLDNKGGV